MSAEALTGGDGGGGRGGGGSGEGGGGGDGSGGSFGAGGGGDGSGGEGLGGGGENAAPCIISGSSGSSTRLSFAACDDILKGYGGSKKITAQEKGERKNEKMARSASVGHQRMQAYSRAGAQ